MLPICSVVLLAQIKFPFLSYLIDSRMLLIAQFISFFIGPLLSAYQIILQTGSALRICLLRKCSFQTYFCRYGVPMVPTLKPFKFLFSCLLLCYSNASVSSFTSMQMTPKSISALLLITLFVLQSLPFTLSRILQSPLNQS